jgi:hypothetical protein
MMRTSASGKRSSRGWGAGIRWALLSAFFACGSSGDGDASSSSGVDLACGPNMYISHDECRPFPSIGSDASLASGEPYDASVDRSQLPLDAAPDGHVTVDATEGGAVGVLDAGSGDTGLDGDAAAILIDVDGACLGIAQSLFLIEGSDSVYNGPPLFIGADAGWSVQITPDMDSGLPATLIFNFGSGNNSWTAWFSTSQLGVPLVAGDYPDAQRAAFAQAGHPGLDIGGQGRGCGGITGEFHVVSISALPGNVDGSTPPQLTSFTATFRQSCSFGTPFDIGCLHFQP